MTAADAASAFCSAITASYPALNVIATVESNVITITSNTIGPINGDWSISGGYGVQAPATLTIIQEGQNGLPPGEFLVADPSNIGNEMGFEAIGKTVQFLSGYGAPPLSIGEEGNGYVDASNGDFYHRDANGWSFITNLEGPQGVQGAPGAQGPQGIQGPMGPSDLYVTQNAGVNWHIQANETNPFTGSNTALFATSTAYNGNGTNQVWWLQLEAVLSAVGQSAVVNRRYRVTFGSNGATGVTEVGTPVLYQTGSGTVLNAVMTNFNGILCVQVNRSANQEIYVSFKTRSQSVPAL